MSELIDDRARWQRRRLVARNRRNHGGHLAFASIDWRTNTLAIQLGAPCRNQSWYSIRNIPKESAVDVTNIALPKIFAAGNGTIRTQHPVELFGQGWLEWELNANSESTEDGANSGDYNKSSG